MSDQENEILQRLARVETKIDMMINARDIALEADQRARSAHHRIDRLDKIVFWAGTTVVGAVIIGVITYVMKTKG